ncbi:hypothetical protein [Mariniflexile sp. HMF6888]|uniref:hypothetical protein n=1 Tax=Mariniflexile sp. HMF6888 TaxID=3373086 RepID=UPI0037BB8582
MKQQLLKLVLLLIISISLINCNKEEVRQTSLNDIQQIQGGFTLENFNDPYIKENLIVDWNDFNTNPEDSITIYEYNTSFKVKRTLENDNQLFKVKYKILAVKDSLENWSFELIKFLANNDRSLNNTSYFYPSTFSGTLYHYNLKGETVKLKAYEDGELIHELDPNKPNINSAQSKYDIKNLSNVDADPDGTGGIYILVTTIHYTDWYANNQGGTTLYYTHSVHNYTTYEYVYVPSSTSSYTTSLHSHTSPQFGSSGGGTNNHDHEVILDEEVIVEGPDKPITNMADYLKCLDPTQSATLTIYVNEPDNNSTNLLGPDGVGHTFVSIQQGNNIASFGFYPVYGIPSLITPVDGVMGDNSNTEYDVSLTINNVSPSNLQKIINRAISYSISDYSLEQQNCTDMGIDLGNLAGLPIPECNANPIYFYGSTPGRLGEYIRNLSSPPSGVTRNTNGGNSPSNNCN